MGIPRTIYYAALSALALAPTNAAARNMSESKAIDMSVEQAAQYMAVSGLGALEPSIMVSSQGFLYKRTGDKWLRAYIDKATGEVEYQIYLRIKTRKSAFGSKELTFMENGALTKASLDRVDFDVDCLRYGCNFYEDAVATVSRTALEQAANSNTPFEFMVFGKHESGIKTRMLRTEITSFLSVVDKNIALISE